MDEIKKTETKDKPLTQEEQIDFLQGVFSDPRVKNSMTPEKRKLIAQVGKFNDENREKNALKDKSSSSSKINPWEKTDKTKNEYKISEKGFELLKKLEGAKRNSENKLIPYNDSKGHATKGYGILIHTGSLTEQDIKDNPPQTEEEALIDLQKKIKEFEDIVNNRTNYIFPKGVQTLSPLKLSESQVDALIHLTFNSPRTCLAITNAMHEGKNLDELKKIWLEEEKNSGLNKRRAAEWKLFSEGIYEENPYN